VAGTFVYDPPVGTVLPAGDHELTATFTPTDTGAYFTPPPVTKTVTVAKASSTTALTASPATSEVGQAVTFTATVTPQIAGAPVTGTVLFTSGSLILGTDTLEDGMASVTTSGLPIGSNPVLATYSGDDNVIGSPGSTTQVVTKVHTTLVARNGQPTILILGNNTMRAKLTRTRDGAPIAGKVVQFTRGGNRLCSATTDADGNAQCTAFVISLLWLNNRYLASYGGDSSHLESHSSALL
jgi:hypothetical protein